MERRTSKYPQHKRLPTLSPLLISLLFPLLLIAQEKIKVDKVYFEGIKKISVKKIKGIIGYKENTFIRKGEILLAIQKIEDFYHSQGFLDARVINYRFLKKDEKYYIYYYIHEGNQKMIKTIELEGRAKEFLQKIEIPFTPVVYKRKIVGEFETFLYSIYRKNGYPFFELERKIYELPGDSVIIIYILKEGKKAIVKNIRIEGLKNIRKKIALREIEIKKGTIFNIEKIANSVSNLYSTGLFSSIEYRTIPEGDSTLVVLIFSMKERKDKVLNIGAGYSSEGDFQIRTNFSHLNIFGNGQKLFLETNILQNLKFTKHFEGNITYLEPFLLGYKLPFSLTLFYYKDTEEKILRRGFESQITKNITRFLQIRTKLGIQKVEGRIEEYKAYLNFLSFSFIFDDRDNFLDPDRGTFFLITPTQSGWIFGGDADIRKLLIDFSFFNQVYFLLLAARFRTGFIWTFARTTEVPISEKFLLGGEGSVRGVSRFSIGEPDPREIKSGNYFVNMNFEFRFKYVPFRIYPVLFFDTGSLKNEIKSLSLKSFVNTIGWGLRWKIFGIILRADVGYKLRNIDFTKGYLYLGLGHMF